MNKWSPENTKTALKKEGRTINWVAEQCGLNPNTLKNYLRGYGVPGLPVKILLSQILNCTLEFIEGEDDEAA